jgi:hypothetical protein
MPRWGWLCSPSRAAGFINSSAGRIMPVPSPEELATALDQKHQSKVDVAGSRLLNEHGLDALIPGLVTAFRRIKSWRGRNWILFELIRTARTHPEVVDLALVGLHDNAYFVRMQSACILANSLRRDVVSHLEKLLAHKDAKTRQYAEAAIDAIKHQNHHYLLDRQHTGNSSWIVNSEDDSSAMPNSGPVK